MGPINSMATGSALTAVLSSWHTRHHLSLQHWQLAHPPQPHRAEPGASSAEMEPDPTLLQSPQSEGVGAALPPATLSALPDRLLLTAALGSRGLQAEPYTSAHWHHSPSRASVAVYHAHHFKGERFRAPSHPALFPSHENCQDGQ